MFLYCGPSTVPIWSGTRIFYIVGRLVFLFGQEQTIFYTPSTTGNIYSEKIKRLFYMIGNIGLSGCA